MKKMKHLVWMDVCTFPRFSYSLWVHLYDSRNDEWICFETAGVIKAGGNIRGDSNKQSPHAQT